MIEAIFRARARSGTIVEILGETFFRDELQIPGHAEYILSKNYYEWYYAIAAALRPRFIFEIGVRFGYSLGAMIAGASDALRRVEGWDNESYSAGSLACAKSQLHEVIPKLGMRLGPELVLEFKDSQTQISAPLDIDLAHIDGAHGFDQKLRDLRLCLPNAQTIIVDDYHFIDDVRRACDSFLTTLSPADFYWFVLPSYRGTLIIHRYSSRASLRIEDSRLEPSNHATGKEFVDPTDSLSRGLSA